MPSLQLPAIPRTMYPEIGPGRESPEWPIREIKEPAYRQPAATHPFCLIGAVAVEQGPEAQSRGAVRQMIKGEVEIGEVVRTVPQIDAEARKPPYVSGTHDAQHGHALAVTLGFEDEEVVAERLDQLRQKTRSVQRIPAVLVTVVLSCERVKRQWVYRAGRNEPDMNACLLYTSDAADDLLCVDLGGRRIIKKKK